MSPLHYGSLINDRETLVEIGVPTNWTLRCDRSRLPNQYILTNELGLEVGRTNGLNVPALQYIIDNANQNLDLPTEGTSLNEQELTIPEPASAEVLEEAETSDEQGLLSDDAPVEEEVSEDTPDAPDDEELVVEDYPEDQLADGDEMIEDQSSDDVMDGDLIDRVSLVKQIAKMRSADRVSSFLEHEDPVVAEAAKDRLDQISK